MLDASLKPSGIVAYLDQYVIGQADAKRTVAVAVYSHFRKIERARRNDQGSLRERKRVRMMLARIIESQSSFTDSETMLREGLALPAEADMDPRLKFLLSRCLVNLGRGAEAKSVLAKLIADYPKHAITATARKTLEAMK